jgi:hypothetical protein
MKRSKTREQLLKSTIEHFNLRNRAMHPSGGCYYHLKLKDDDKVRRCAIGRELPINLAIELDKNFQGSVNDIETFEKLPERLKQMGQKFLHKVQELHDRKSNWNEKGLSRNGKKKAQGIIDKFNLNMTL